MSCYHPYVYVNHYDLSDPIQRRIFSSIKSKHLGDDDFNRYHQGLFVPREVAISEGIDLEKNHALLVPCGRCIGCRLDYSRQWAERCIHEAKEHQYNYFLTLTYDDDHLPIGEKGFATLIEDEVSAFMKRLRKAMKKECGVDNIRFFACGEYGDGNGDSPDIHVMFRPHYHIILFNCPLPDLQERHPIMVDGKLKMIRQYDSNGELLLFSPLVHRAWQQRGTAQIGQVTYESAAYVARYVVKKLYGKDGLAYSDQGVIPPFVRMSRMPGIGFNWYMTNMKHIYQFDDVYVSISKKQLHCVFLKACHNIYQAFE